MDSETDNKFMTLLSENFSDVLEYAISQNCVVCVPMAASIAGKHITRRFIRIAYTVDHMLKPSPYVPNLFQSLSNKNLLIKQDEIKSHTGYQNSFTVMIIKEENSHDARGKVYKQVTISAPLDDTADKYTLIPPDPIYQFSSAEEFASFLKFAVEGSEAAVMFADAFGQHFNTSYIPFKTYARECYDKVKTGLRDMQAVLFISDLSKDSSILRCAEFSSTLQLFDRPSRKKIIEFSSEDEEEFQKDCRVVREGRMDKFGLEADIELCEFVESHQVLKSLNDYKTPWEKLGVITKLAGTIDSEIKQHLQSIDPEKAEKWSMSADQYFPILTKFIALKQVPSLLANLTFISELSLCPMSSSEQKYHYINVLATIQSIKKHAEETVKIPLVPVVLQQVKKPREQKKVLRDVQAISLSDSSGEEEEGLR